MRYLSGNDIASVAGQTKESCWRICEEDDIKHCKCVNKSFCSLLSRGKKRDEKSSSFLLKIMFKNVLGQLILTQIIIIAI